VDVTKAERVNKLARSLKDFHLAATMEEAYKRAEEIIAGSTKDNDEKTLNELMGANGGFVNAPVEEIIIGANDGAVESSDSSTGDKK